MRRAVARAVIIVATCAFASPFAVSAQATTKPEPARRPLLLLGFETSRPLHEIATVGTLIPLRPLEQADSSLYEYRGVIVEGAAGDSGYGVAAGWGSRLKKSGGFALFGHDVMATWFRRRGEARDATYVGGEFGFTFLVPPARVSLGVATRVAGPDEVDRTIFTWGLGFHVGR
jgi:hypothetical protein